MIRAPGCAAEADMVALGHFLLQRRTGSWRYSQRALLLTRPFRSRASLTLNCHFVTVLQMIVILMELRGFDLQTAVDFVGDLCRQTIDTFMENQQNVPSFGPRLDRDVALYMQGLQDWIVGSLHWSFMTERYFGKSGAEVKKNRIVRLLPRRPKRIDVSA